jgi:GR25 family glycosyltransferase involved in LPS biosynthesis
MIIDKNDLEVWMISLIGNHHADALRTVTVPKWEKEGLKVNLFDAIKPNTMYDLPYQLKFGMKENVNRNPVEFTETEKAVWYSHLQLWEKCSIGNMTFLIIEEDTKPKKRFPNSIVVDRLYKISSAGIFLYS